MQPSQKPNWTVNDSFAQRSKFEKFAQKHGDEYASLFANLKKILGLLQSGNKIGGFHVGFFRSEADGLYRIGQTGIAHALESRLYIYPDSERQILYILSIGTKDTQSDDINEAKHCIKKEIRKPDNDLTK